MKKHYTIPIFIPELACPHQCVFCNQRKISGSLAVPAPAEVENIISSHLGTIPVENSRVEIGFFGGNFTGIPIPDQKKYLHMAYPFLKSGKVSGIRLSTRPDYIDNQILDLLREYGVSTIELGAQSMVDEVLLKSGRGHSVANTVRASQMVLDSGFELGLQMMIGLPGDTLDRTLYTAKKIIELGANNTRIYPTLVIRDTVLAEMYLREKYYPLSMDQALMWSKECYKVFESAGVNVIRMGLHPSEGLLSGEELLAGPFHPSFRELVMTEIWNEELMNLSEVPAGERISISVHPKQINFAVGYHGKNKSMLLKTFKKVVFKPDRALKGREFHVDHH